MKSLSRPSRRASVDLRLRCEPTDSIAGRLWSRRLPISRMRGRSEISVTPLRLVGPPSFPRLERFAMDGLDPGPLHDGEHIGHAVGSPFGAGHQYAQVSLVVEFGIEGYFRVLVVGQHE